MTGEPDARWPVGGLWEDPGIDLKFNVDMDRTVNGSIFKHYGRETEPGPCPHAQNLKREPTLDGTEPAERESWTVPRVIEAWNEAGHASTGVCMDCVLDFAESLKGTTDDDSR